MYRRIASALQTRYGCDCFSSLVMLLFLEQMLLAYFSTYMKDFDPFSLQKTEALDKSIPGAIIMAEFLQKCGDENKDSSGFTKHFQTFLKVILCVSKFDSTIMFFILLDNVTTHCY